MNRTATGLLLGLGLIATATGCSNAKGADEMPAPSGEHAAPLPEFPPVRSGSASPADEPSRTVGAGARVTGTTYPKARAEVAARATGAITRMFVQEGDRLRKGAKLFSVDVREARLEVNRANASLKSARVRLRSVKVEYDRARRLFEQKASSGAEWDAAQADHDAAAAAVELSEAAVALAKQNVAEGSVAAPIPGTVVERRRAVGDTVTASTDVVVVIEDHSILELRFRVPEPQVASLAVGDSIRITFPNRAPVRTATIVRISPTVDRTTRTVEVVAELPNPDGTLRAGMLTEVQLEAAAVPSTRDVP